MTQTSANYSDTLTFYLASYTFQGQFLGFTQLSTELELCPVAKDTGVRYTKFGTNFLNKCSFDIASVFYNFTQTMFYELCKKEEITTHLMSKQIYWGKMALCTQFLF
jgi:hypothetical protein